MEALVTGGAGFIGSHLVDALVDRGDHVVVVDDLSTGRRENLDDALTKDAELLETDITDAAAVADVFQTRRPEVGLHLAAQIDVRRSVSDPGFDLGVNVGGTLNLLEAARQTGTRRFVPASTGGGGGRVGGPWHLQRRHRRRDERARAGPPPGERLRARVRTGDGAGAARGGTANRDRQRARRERPRLAVPHRARGGPAGHRGLLRL